MRQVIVQRVRCVWTKKSRGGDAARLRNAVPEAARLPQIDRKAKFILHFVEFWEGLDFEQADTVRTADQFAGLSIRDLLLRDEADSLAVRFLRDCNNLAAPSPYPFRDVFSLRAMDWGRVVFNARYCAWNYGMWWYEKSVYNIGYRDAYPPTIFTSTRPTAEFREMARLA